MTVLQWPPQSPGYNLFEDLCDVAEWGSYFINVNKILELFHLSSRFSPDLLPQHALKVQA